MNFEPVRGLRQGDPLSPYLSLIYVKAFSALLNIYELENKIKGIKICKEATTVTHLFFIVDSLIFLKADNINCRQFKHILEKYERESG